MLAREIETANADLVYAEQQFARKSDGHDIEPAHDRAGDVQARTAKQSSGIVTTRNQPARSCRKNRTSRVATNHKPGRAGGLTGRRP